MGVQGHPNHDKDIMRDIEGQQLVYILVMTFMSVEKLEDDEKQAYDLYYICIIFLIIVITTFCKV